MAETTVANIAITLVWRLFAPYTASKLEKGDVAEERLRQMLLSEFNKIHEHLNALRRKELVSAVGFLETGYELLSKDQQTAASEFEKARDAAQMAFGVVKSTTDKLLAAKIMVTSAFHEFSLNPATAQSLCQKYLERMNSLPEVVRTCEVIFSPEKSMGAKLVTFTGKSERREILQSVAEINKCVWDYFTGQFCTELSPPPVIRFGEYHISPVTDMITYRNPILVADIEKDLSHFVSVAMAGPYIFAALRQSTNTSLLGDVIAINMYTGHITHLLGHAGVVLSLETSGNLLFSASFDQSIIAWSVDSLQIVKKLSGHAGSVRSLCISSSYLFSGSTDGTVKVWDLNLLEEVRSLELGELVSYVTSSRRKFLFVIVGVRRIHIWDCTTFEKLCELYEEQSPVSIIANENLMFVMCKTMAGPSIEIWNLGSLHKVASISEDITNVVKVYNSPYLLCGTEKIKVINTRGQRLIAEQEVYVDHRSVATRIKFLWISGSSLYVMCETESGRSCIVKY